MVHNNTLFSPKKYKILTYNGDPVTIKSIESACFYDDWQKRLTTESFMYGIWNEHDSLEIDFFSQSTEIDDLIQRYLQKKAHQSTNSPFVSRNHNQNNLTKGSNWIREFSKFLEIISQCDFVTVQTSLVVESTGFFNRGNYCEIIRGDAFPIGTKVIVLDCRYNGVMTYLCIPANDSQNSQSSRLVVEESLKLISHQAPMS